jgi:hypothetical protein
VLQGRMSTCVVPAAKWSRCDHCFGQAWMKHLRKFSIHWFTLSVWSSLCGWYAVMQNSCRVEYQRVWIVLSTGGW